MKLQRLTDRRHSAGQLVAWLGLLCFSLSTAVLPAGHMAAPLSSGTAFHLCPSDAGSAVWLKLTAPATTPLLSEHQGHHGHHGHHSAPHAAIAGAEDHNSSNADGHHQASSSGVECKLGGAAQALLPIFTTDIPEDISRGIPVLAQLPAFKPRQPSWLRPPVRSPTV